MALNKTLNLIGISLLAALLLGCSSGESPAAEVATATSAPNYSCPSGALTTAVYNIEDLTSYIVHNWDYIERSEGAPRELYMEEIATVTLENGEVADTDSAFTIYFDDLHKSDWVRVDGVAYVRHNEGTWERLDSAPDWAATADGLMGDSLYSFYDSLAKASDTWGHPDQFDFTPGDPYCELKEVDFNGRSAWQFIHHNVPQWVFQAGFGGRRGGADSYQGVQEKMQSGWTFQSADYSATVVDLYATPQLVAESVRVKIGDGSGSAMYTTWETAWSNFNEPVTIRRPQ